MSTTEFFGVLRSLLLYWRPGRQRSLRCFYSPLVKDGDLVFDVGAHLGDRSIALAALGARVIAIEPQPQLLPWLRLITGRNDRITLRTEALGATSGIGFLRISPRTPTVSTMSEKWKETISIANPSFRSVFWKDPVEIRVITLDKLIQIYGVPSFCKIDVEGYESKVLEGLSCAIPALSIEFISGALDVAANSVTKLGELGPYIFNVVEGEGRRFLFEDWLSISELLDWLERGAGRASSGDIYAQLQS